jgi:hypothetical protein
MLLNIKELGSRSQDSGTKPSPGSELGGEVLSDYSLQLTAYWLLPTAFCLRPGPKGRDQVLGAGGGKTGRSGDRVIARSHLC